MLMLGFSVVRSQSEHVMGISAFAFGMLLIGAGVVAYSLNGMLKPAGWGTAPETRTGSLKILATDFADFTD